MNLARGVEFFPEKHEYYYKGKRLSGVTGLIAKRLGIAMPEEFVGEHRDEGIHVHKAIQRWIETGDSGSVHQGVAWITQELWPTCGHEGRPVFAEVLVSDFKKHASAVDIVVDLGEERLAIYDIKTGVFKRDYVSWQLGVYKYFIEAYTSYRVADCACICVRDKERYPIFPKEEKDVEELLYGRQDRRR
jgi:hypothetical protein